MANLAISHDNLAGSGAAKNVRRKTTSVSAWRLRATTRIAYDVRSRAARTAEDGPPRREEAAPDRSRRRRAEIQFLTGAILHRGGDLGAMDIDGSPGMRTSWPKIRSVAVSRSWSAPASRLRIGSLMQIEPIVSDARPRDSAIRRSLPRAIPRLAARAAAMNAPGTLDDPSRFRRSQRSTAARRRNSDTVVSSVSETSPIQFTSQSGNLTLTFLAKRHLLEDLSAGWEGNPFRYFVGHCRATQEGVELRLFCIASRIFCHLNREVKTHTRHIFARSATQRKTGGAMKPPPG